MEKRPDYQAACGLFQYCTIQELNAYMDQESKLDEMIRDLPQVKEWDADKDLLLTENKSLAESNFKLEPKLNALKAELVEKSAAAQSMLVELTQQKSLLDQPSNAKSADSVLAILQAEHASSDESSENLVQSFLNSETTLDHFLESYLKLRREVYMKRVKVDKLKELLRNRRSSVATRPPPPVPSMGPASMSSPPYPVNSPVGGVPVFPTFGMPYRPPY